MDINSSAQPDDTPFPRALKHFREIAHDQSAVKCFKALEEGTLSTGFADVDRENILYNTCQPVLGV